MSATVEKFAAATNLLVRSGHIKERLDAAYRQCLSAIDAAELPRELRDEFTQFCSSIQSVRPASRSEDKLRATIRKMSSEEADRHAETVVRLFGALARHVGAAQSRPALAVSNILNGTQTNGVALSTNGKQAGPVQSDDLLRHYRAAAEA
ncbi:MAG TPA: hypothetical protein P5528_14500 [Steroidobacteraceae bacterium]|nr:hypothetical protein [Steroidobacteraceae bacterium]